MVERFGPATRTVGSPAMLPQSYGGWVRYSKYAELAAENERLQTLVDVGEDRIRNLRLEAQALANTGAVKVKPLNWRVFCSRSGNSTAETCIGEYVVQHEHDLWMVYRPYEDIRHGKGFNTQSEAKAAAQVDYEHRILSALEPAVPELCSMEAYNAATKAMAARMANTAILVGDGEPSIDGEHTDADGYPYAFDAPEGQQPAAYIYEIASYYNKETDEYSGWKRGLSQTKPNAGRGQRNVTPLYIRPSEQAVTEAMVEAAAIAISGGREDLWDGFDLFKRASFRTRALHALKAAMEAGR